MPFLTIVTPFDIEARDRRAETRIEPVVAMGTVARMAVYATERALTDAGLLEDHCIIRGGRAHFVPPELASPLAAVADVGYELPESQH